MRRRTLLAAAGAAASVGLPVQAQSATYPSKPIRLMLPFPAGSPTDAIARKIAEACGPKLGQPVVVDNKAGASGSIGTAEILRSAPDGYNLTIAIPDSLIGVASLIKNPGYDARTDITPIMKFCNAVLVMIASKPTGVKNVAELLAAARARPGRIAYGSWGQGTIVHLLMKSIEDLTQTSFLNVPYKGLAPILTDIVGDQVQIAVVPGSIAAQYEQKGLTTTPCTFGTRSPQVPNVPTIQEQGLDAPMLRSGLWTSIVGPKGLPAAVVKRWNDVLMEVGRSPDMVQFLASIGQTPVLQGGEAFGRDLLAEWNTTTEITRKMGITPA